MKLHDFLDCRLATAGEPIPKLSPDLMSFWRKDGDVYHEYPINLAPVALDDKLMDVPALSLEDLQEGDLISFPNVIYPAKEVMDQLATAGYLKIRALDKRLAITRL